MNRLSRLLVLGLVGLAGPAAASETIRRDMPDRDQVIASQASQEAREGCRAALYGELIPRTGQARRAAYHGCGAIYRTRLEARMFPRGLAAHVAETPSITCRFWRSRSAGGGFCY